MESRRHHGCGGASPPRRARPGAGLPATTWADLDRRASAVAAALVERGAERQEKVAQYLYNGPEYLESVVGSFKAALVPVNTNYRYQDAELLYLWDNADVVAVVFHGAFTERIEGCARACRRSTPGSGSMTAAAAPGLGDRLRGDRRIGRRARPAALPWLRCGDDLLLSTPAAPPGFPRA